MAVLAAGLGLFLIAASGAGVSKLIVPVADLGSVEADFETGRIEIVVSGTRYVWIDRNRDPEAKRRALEEKLAKIRGAESLEIDSVPYGNYRKIVGLRFLAPVPVSGAGAQVDLRSRLEAVYGEVQAALAGDDPDDLFALLESDQPPARLTPERWQEATAELAEIYPPRGDMRFLRIETRGDWAGYCFEDLTGDAARVSLQILRFHRTQGRWRLIAGSPGVYFERSRDPLDDDRRVGGILATHPTFRLPGDPGLVQRTWVADEERERARERLRAAGWEATPAALARALSPPSLEKIELVLKAGVSPDSVVDPVGGKGPTIPIDFLVGAACGRAGSLEALTLVIAAGAEVGAAGPYGSTAVHRAVGCPDALRVLLRAGVEVDAKDAEGVTALARAVARGETGSVAALLSADPDLAAEGPELLALAPKPEIAELLRAAGAPYAASSSDEAAAELGRRGLTPDERGYWASVMKLEVDNVRLYLEAGILPDTRRSPPQNDTALLFAVTVGCSRDAEVARRMVETLLELGADPDGADDNGSTPLIWAVGGCPTELLRTLVEAGADVQARARGGATAMTMAVVRDQAEVVELLLEAGFELGEDQEMLLTAASGKPEIERLLRGAVR